MNIPYQTWKLILELEKSGEYKSIANSHFKICLSNAKLNLFAISWIKYTSFLLYKENLMVEG